ncbi:MAG: hypothetical protein ACOCQQ_00625 [Candidatus Nanoarchaeia archaeon]
MENLKQNRLEKLKLNYSHTLEKDKNYFNLCLAFLAVATTLLGLELSLRNGGVGYLIFLGLTIILLIVSLLMRKIIFKKSDDLYDELIKFYEG